MDNRATSHIRPLPDSLERIGESSLLGGSWIKMYNGILPAGVTRATADSTTSSSPGGASSPSSGICRHIQPLVYPLLCSHTQPNRALFQSTWTSTAPSHASTHPLPVHIHPFHAFPHRPSIFFLLPNSFNSSQPQPNLKNKAAQWCSSLPCPLPCPWWWSSCRKKCSYRQ